MSEAETFEAPTAAEAIQQAIDALNELSWAMSGIVSLLRKVNTECTQYPELRVLSDAICRLEDEAGCDVMSHLYAAQRAIVGDEGGGE